MKKIEVVVKEGRSWIVCPHCEKGRWMDVANDYVGKKAKCACGKIFEIFFMRRKCDRKNVEILGKLENKRSAIYPITLKDLSLQGVGFVIYSATVAVGEEYDITFSFSGHTVETTVKIVSVRSGIIGGQFIFIDEYCSAKLSVRRIWNQLP